MNPHFGILYLLWHILQLAETHIKWVLIVGYLLKPIFGIHRESNILQDQPWTPFHNVSRKFALWFSFAKGLFSPSDYWNVLSLKKTLVFPIRCFSKSFSIIWNSEVNSSISASIGSLTFYAVRPCAFFTLMEVVGAIVLDENVYNISYFHYCSILFNLYSIAIAMFDWYTGKICTSLFPTSLILSI